MQIQQSQTETSVVETPIKKNNKKSKQQQKTKKKKVKKISGNQEETESIKTNKKGKNNSSNKQKVLLNQQKIEQDQQVKIRKIQIAPTKVQDRQSSIYLSNFCKHKSVCNKLFFSLMWTIISMILFRESKGISYPIAQYEQGEHKAVFEIVTDRKIRNIKFNIKDKKQMGYLPIDSVKSARVHAKVEYSLGYEFENQRVQHRQRFGSQQNHQIKLSGLKILHYSIMDVKLQNKQDGLWNTWEFQSTEELKQFIQKHYIQDMKKQTLQAITNQRKKLYENKAKLMLTNIVDKYESWFDWLLKRIDNYVDGGLQPYLNQYKITFDDKASSSAP